MYTAAVLNRESHLRLLAQFPPPIGWTVYCHHMTINMGPATDGPCADRLGEEVTLKITGSASDDKVMAVRVETGVPSDNAVKHITVAVDRQAGGKPFYSNKLENWTEVEGVELRAVIEEVP